MKITPGWREMIINFKRTHPNAVIPTKAHTHDAAFDLTAVSMRIDTHYGFIEYDTGIACDIKPGFCGLVFARSSISKYDLILANGVAVIDSGYKSSILLRFKPVDKIDYNELHMRNIYLPGDRIGQLVIQQVLDVEFNEVFDMSPNRGSFGSSGV